MTKILGLDLGTASIGWALVERNDTGYALLDQGVDIFQEGVAREKNSEKPAVQDRTAARALAPSLCPATIAQDRPAPCARSPRPLSCSDRRTTERLETEENLSADGRVYPLATNGRPHGQESLPRPLQGADRNARSRHAKGPLHARPGLISSGAAARIPEQSQGCRRRKRER